MELDIVIKHIAKALAIVEQSVRNTVDLIIEGGTIPFIARYRRERIGGLTEIQVRAIFEHYEYYVALEDRKAVILKSIAEQEKLTEALKAEILDCCDRQKLEDIYIPYKPKKRTKATIAYEKGLGPLAELILKQERAGEKKNIVESFIDKEKGVVSYKDALEGALCIVAEKIAEEVGVREWLRSYIIARGTIFVRARKEWEEKKSTFEMYYHFSDSIKKIPSYRILAIRRGANEGVLTWKISVDNELTLSLLEYKVIKDRKALFIEELRAALQDSYKRLLMPALATEVFLLKLERAEAEAIKVFEENLRHLFLASPAGHKVIMGIDPGIRTGCKVAVIDRQGDFKEYQQIFVTHSAQQKAKAEEIVIELIAKYGVELIAIGNGTASKETSIFINEVVKKHNCAVAVLIVNEAGASVYSVSEIAQREFPDFDVTIRGAISIARRLQDPLSELVKIAPKSIGVGQYQHDVNQVKLKKALDFVVESCVNYVGVDLNIASLELLSYVAGIGPVLAQKIVEYRQEHGPFRNKQELLKIPRLGARVFQQCAGFLRIAGGDNPLDNSAVHPENYYVVEKMAHDKRVNVVDIMGNESVLATIRADDYVNDTLGLITVRSILDEIKKPGRDPRKEFISEVSLLQLNSIEDLAIGMVVEGKVTNVTNFGAFVDIGIHREGLLHLSRLSKRYVKNAHAVVAVGNTVKVRIVSIDKELNRIGLEMIE